MNSSDNKHFRPFVNLKGHSNALLCAWISEMYDIKSYIYSFQTLCYCNKYSWL